VKSLRGMAVAVIAAMTASACTASGGAAPVESPPLGSSPDLRQFYEQKVSWTDCKNGFQCANVKVPKDYRNPGDGQLSISVIRLPARVKEQRIGSLVTNPGGPGGSGVKFIRESGQAFGKSLRDRFDLVGFDPRGVGESDPVRCLEPKDLDRYFATDSSPDDQKEETALVSVGKHFAQGCESRAGKTLPYIGTLDAARDMDVLRSALGDKRLSYIGFSYGTYLGAFYADQFPKNVRALVLDGAVDPKLSSNEINLEQAKGFETALRAFAADCVKSPDCPLGTGSVDEALRKISELQRRADQKPLRNTTGDGRQVTEALATLGIATALYNKQSWAALRVALKQAVKGDGSMLLRLGDLLVERSEDGRYTNQTEANMAINCVDKPYPADLKAASRVADEAKKIAPRFGPFVVWGSLPCTYWPAKTGQEAKALAAKGAAPIVVVGTTRDPATPYKWAEGLAGELSSGRLLTLEGDGHTAYLQGNPCISRAVENYLIKEQAPAERAVCR
jgi:pimeloyl-ACP methyl ester carboxylesterase